MTTEQQPAGQGRGVGELPALPNSFGDHCVTDSVRTMREPGYTANQMRDYARAAIAALSQPKGEVVMRVLQCPNCPTSVETQDKREFVPCLRCGAYMDEDSTAKVSLPRQSEAVGYTSQSALNSLTNEYASGVMFGAYSERYERTIPLYTTPQPAQADTTPAAQRTVYKGWPFVESPGDFAERLHAAMQRFPLLGAVRHVLIEDPPTLTTPAAHGVGDGMVELAMKAGQEYWDSPDQVASCDECNGTGKVPSGDSQDWCGACDGGVINTGTEEGAMRAALTAALQAASAPGGPPAGKEEG